MSKEADGSTAETMTISGKHIDSRSGKLLVTFSSPVSPTVMDLLAPGRPAQALDFADAACEQFATKSGQGYGRQQTNTGTLPPPK